MKRLGSSPTITLLMLTAGASVLAGCGQSPVATPKSAEAPAGGYLPPPTLTDATREADGGIHINGRAPPDAQISLRSPDGTQLGAHSGSDGLWSMDAPPSQTPRLFAFEAKAGSQTVHGEGALALMPAPATPALVLRAGFAAVASGVAPRGLQLVDFDYDGGGAAVGGFAPAGSPVRLSIDGAAIGLAKADAQGRFAVLATGQGVAAGAHTLRIETPQGLAIERRVEVKPPAIPADKAFLAERADGGWVLSWRLPGGSAQTSLVFDSAVAPPASGR